MAKDHFIPRAYLRGFTEGYLTGEKGGELIVYSPSSGNAGKLSINDYVGCEPEFYNNHPVDKLWSQTIEQSWPSVRKSLKEQEADAALLDSLFWFVGAQFIRTHSFMNRVAHTVAVQNAKRVNRGGKRGMILNMTATTAVMDRVQSLWPHARLQLEKDYTWKVYHNSHSRLFLTSDNPCQGGVAGNSGVIMPIALDMALVGRLLEPGEKPTFGHSKAAMEMVAKINRAVVRECNSHVYAHCETDDLRRFVKENYVRPDVMTGGRSFANNPDPLDDADIDRLFDHIEKLRRKDATNAALWPKPTERQSVRDQIESAIIFARSDFHASSKSPTQLSVFVTAPAISITCSSSMARRSERWKQNPKVTR